MDGVRTRLSGPVIGCADAWELAEFYASLLGWKVVDRSQKVPGGWALVKSPDGGHKLEFQREEPFVPPIWPTVAGQQQMGMHLDIAVDNLGGTGSTHPLLHAARRRRGERRAGRRPPAARGPRRRHARSGRTSVLLVSRERLTPNEPRVSPVKDISTVGQPG